MRPSTIRGICYFSGIFFLISIFTFLKRSHTKKSEWNPEGLDTIKMAPNLRNDDSVPNSVPCNHTQYDFKGADQEDPQLLEYIRRELLVPPSVHPYNLTNPGTVHFSQFNQSKIANALFNGMRDGFFVEVGAVDGETLSNSIFFERELGWSGLLIEASPSYFKAMQKKNRKAYSIHAALAVTTFASEVTLDADIGYSNRLSSHVVTVKGIPLFSILRVLNVEVVDFLSLDIESFEVKVLKTLPWDKIKFRLMCIEVNHIPEGKEFLTEFLQEKGYKFLGYGHNEVDAWYSLPELLETHLKP
ncbi:protein Star-like [Macrobrachium nipponense]|uniref:protein Star-like n=1 Tax=Macrobrachium nipponense TaxID=159736 RepID=UPI0030C85B22